MSRFRPNIVIKGSKPFEEDTWKSILIRDGKGGKGHGITDEELYQRIVQGDETNTFVRARAELLLQEARAQLAGRQTPEECLAYIGNRFRLMSGKANSTSDVAIGHYIVNR